MQRRQDGLMQRETRDASARFLSFGAGKEGALR